MCGGDSMKWQELKCCLEYMESKEVNAAALAPETRQTMIGYMEAIAAKGSPIQTYEELMSALRGKWKMSFTTEDRYKALPPGELVWRFRSIMSRRQWPCSLPLLDAFSLPLWMLLIGNGILFPSATKVYQNFISDERLQNVIKVRANRGNVL